VSVLTQCSACGCWIGDMARHQAVCSGELPRRDDRLAPLDPYVAPWPIRSTHHHVLHSARPINQKERKMKTETKRADKLLPGDSA